MISLIVPVHNHAGTLERSLKSLAYQTYRPLEVIVVDDGSTDNFASYLPAWSRIMPFQFINQPHQGAAAARNRGYREARGEFIIFWDADTIARPEMLARLKRQLDANPEASYAYCQFRFGWKKMKSQPFSVADLRRFNYIDTTSLIRRSALLGVPGPFDESLTRFQDWDLWLTLLEQNKKGIFIPEVLYTKIVHRRQGISSWLPSFAYQLPGRFQAARLYQQARAKVLAKHQLPIT